ncbi:hypothetical protein [Kribbella catacumbae]|uniref:hypothetical protein n=1 Tax=Kribbella catacumbae TaxID=460086 RepID=UPI00037571C5|nr:hypothetical protein [Kribbella catacumbae]
MVTGDQDNIGRGDEAPAWLVRREVVPVDPAKMVGPGGIVSRQGVRSPDYGTGTIVGLTANGVTIYWDQPLSGTRCHLLEHDRSYVERLERLE